MAFMFIRDQILGVTRSKPIPAIERVRHFVVVYACITADLTGHTDWGRQYVGTGPTDHEHCKRPRHIGANGRLIGTCRPTRTGSASAEVSIRSLTGKGSNWPVCRWHLQWTFR